MCLCSACVILLRWGSTEMVVIDHNSTYHHPLKSTACHHFVPQFPGNFNSSNACLMRFNDPLKAVDGRRGCVLVLRQHAQLSPSLWGSIAQHLYSVNKSFHTTCRATWGYLKVSVRISSCFSFSQQNVLFSGTASILCANIPQEAPDQLQNKKAVKAEETLLEGRCWEHAYVVALCLFTVPGWGEELATPFLSVEILGLRLRYAFTAPVPCLS